MALLPNAGIQAFISSAKNKIEHFLSGFSGYGWKIWEWTTGRYKMEIDDLTVRRTMTVYELIISKIRSVMGALAITQAHGKIKDIDSYSDANHYLITLEDTNSFVEGDFIRMQEFSGGYRSYWVEVTEIRDEKVVIHKTEFDGEGSTPEIGDELVQFGNRYSKGRQSAIYLHADETGQPAIDVMFDIDSKSFDGKTKLRLGAGLPGVSDDFKGLYAENGMLKFTDAVGKTTAQIWPDGAAEFGAGSVAINPDKSGYIGGPNGLSWYWDTLKNRFVCEFGDDAVLKWKNIAEDARENLKGEPGVPGPAGEDGKIYYTWIRYANDVNGKGMSDNPIGKEYMGLAYNKTTSVESNDPREYKWGKFRGETGTEGQPGPTGKNGKTYYTWIAYSDSSDGKNMYQIPNDDTKYIGIAVNKETVTESDIPADYVWSKFRGDDGDDANLLPWIKDWDDNKTRIGNEFVISPKMFAGTSTNNKLTGVALGRKVVTIDGLAKTGLYGLKNGEMTFGLNAETGDAMFKGEINATSGTFRGYLSIPFINIENSDAVFDSSTRVWRIKKNLSLVTISRGTHIDNEYIELPTDISYNGCCITILNPNYPPYTRTSLRYCTVVRVQGGGYIRGTHNQSNLGSETEDVTQISFLGAIVEFIATPVWDWSTGQYTGVEWMVVGYNK